MGPGTATAAADESQVEIFPLRGGSEHAAANPYQSVTASQGTCTITPMGAYQVADCALGDLAAGASAQIVAVLQVNESMNHVAAPKVGTWSELDADDSGHAQGRARAEADCHVRAVRMSGRCVPPAGITPPG